MIPDSFALTTALGDPIPAPEVALDNWCPVSPGDVVVEHIAATYWDRPGSPQDWEVARLSQAMFVYRERVSGWTLAAKFYAAKTGDAAEKYASQELARIRKVQSLGLATGPVRAVVPRGMWRSVLFLEYVTGLTLEDIIAVRRSQPGRLTRSLELTARLLALLHGNSLDPQAPATLQRWTEYAEKVINNLARWGVLQEDPVLSSGLLQLVDRWAGDSAPGGFVPTLIHGDTTTTNFLFPSADTVVAVDWERAKLDDPALDLGRLLAEVSHSIHQHGGHGAEAETFVAHLVESYVAAGSAVSDYDTFLERVRFHRAVSTLRIARNGWLSRLDRTALVAHAAILLIPSGLSGKTAA